MLGRPAIIETVEELDERIEAYFKKCEPVPMRYTDPADGIEKIATDKNGHPIIIEHTPSMAELAYDLGYSSRQAIYDIEHRGDDFSYSIKRARLRIEAFHEGQLGSRDKCTGDIFWLKNHGWSDSKDVNLGASNGGVKLEIEYVGKEKPE